MKRPDRQNLLIPLSVLVPALFAFWAGEGCKGDLTIGHDDGGAGYAGAGGGSVDGAGGGGGTGGSAGPSGQAGAGEINRYCRTGPDEVGSMLNGCGRSCAIDGVNSQFVCNEEGQCVQGPVVCGSGLCAGKACGEGCLQAPFTFCDAQGRCIAGPVDCGRPADLCAGKACGEYVNLGPTTCACNTSGQCLHGGPIDCGACAGVECGRFCGGAGGAVALCNAEGRCVHSPYLGLCDANPRCAGKACGADCSVEGFDVPLSCNPQGHCVAASVPCAP